MNVVGFLMWSKFRQGTSVIMKKLRLQGLLLVVLIAVIGSFTLGFGLSLIPGQNNPYIDALTNMLSIIATVLMVRRFKEQWLVYIVLNVFTVLLWTIRTLDGSPDGLLMIVMWSAYLINAIYGYYTWNKGAKGAKEAM